MTCLAFVSVAKEHIINLLEFKRKKAYTLFHVYVYAFTMVVQLNNNLHNLLAIVFIIDTQQFKDADEC